MSRSVCINRMKTSSHLHVRHLKYFMDASTSLTDSKLRDYYTSVWQTFTHRSPYNIRQSDRHLLTDHYTKSVSLANIYSQITIQNPSVWQTFTHRSLYNIHQSDRHLLTDHYTISVSLTYIYSQITIQVIIFHYTTKCATCVLHL